MKTKIIYKLALILGICMLTISCGGDKSDEPDTKPEEQLFPVAAVLISPEKNEPCNQGNVLEDTTLSNVTFDWNISANTDSYILVVKNLEDGTLKQATATPTTASLNLKRGVSYEWFVTSKSTNSLETTNSQTWEFYNAAEGIQTHVPYPASLIAPANEVTTSSTTVLLEWNASDIDNDIEMYEVYIGTSKNQLEKQTTVQTSEMTMNLQASTIYYWKVYTKDATGNVSISSVFEFTTP
ncbi:hypothetical protein FHR24_002369 [Wenyingzhuangia heitensis]|uniref:Fibronectin type-III domain-containing protein n=1 Tax=Wenyingzhuangia heitensis TaxID=1487859 RepID=A0ABX0UAQ6_9FLAO|nr:hypothetical protein [Wenyingzhuangia heitensis]NIJ45898.1 hypothetical protein [Wenyingzhuangia heitensis]